MTPFLQHLAGMALGKPTARVSLPPRFASSSEVMALDEQEHTTRSHPRELSQPPTAGDIGDHVADGAEPAGAEAPRQRVSEGRSPLMPAVPPTPLASVVEGHGRPDGSPVRAPTPPRDSQIPTPVVVSRRPLLGAAVPAVVPPAAAVGRDARVAPPPLSDVAVASRVRARDQGGAPVVHVTIDRIDVRAPAAATPRPARQRERAEPAVSLAEYLRGAEPAGRA